MRKAIYTRTFPKAFVQGKWTHETVESEVRVMAEAEGYAMVRHKGCVPFAVRLKELRPLGKDGKP